MSEVQSTVLTVSKEPPPAVVDIERLEMIPVDRLVDRAQQMAAQGARLVTATCNDVGDGFEVLYHFDLDLQMSHVGVKIGKDETLPSITGAYLCAFLVENEIEDLFGLQVDGMPLDYRHHLVLAGESTPTPLLKDRGQE